MPKVTVYIRKEDYEKWKAIEKKTQFISDVLNLSTPRTPKFETIVEDEGTPAEKIRTIEKLKVGANQCKVHGLPLTAYGKCLQKGCKYS